MAVYRYRLDLVNIARISKLVGASAPSLSAASPNFVDLAFTGTKADLDEVMAAQGFAYVSTDPGDTPTAAVAAALANAAFDVRDLLLSDHFLSGSDLTQRIGNHSWINLVTGTGSDLGFVSEAGHPGIMDGGAGSTAAGRACVYLGDTTFTVITLSGSQNQIDMEWLIRLNTASLSATNNERFTLGFGDGWDASAGTEHNNGVYLELNPSLSANFKLVTKASGTATRTDSTITPAAATWYRIGLQITYPGGTPTAKLFINGTERASATANFPSAGLGVGIRLDANVNSAEPRWQADYMKLTQVTAKET